MLKTLDKILSIWKKFRKNFYTKLFFYLLALIASANILIFPSKVSDFVVSSFGAIFMVEFIIILVLLIKGRKDEYKNKS